MRFFYGGKQFEAGEFGLSRFETVATRENGEITKITTTLSVTFDIVRSTQATIRARFNEIANAIKFDGRDVGFLEDDGTVSAIFIDSSLTASGVFITKYPSIESGDGADYATHLKGSCEFMAEWLPENFGGGDKNKKKEQKLTNFRETLSVRGTGGPRVAIDVVDRGPPREYVLADRTPILAKQSGQLEVVGKTPFYPSPNPPMWPDALIPETAEHAKEITPENDGTFRMSVSWNYEFQSPDTLFGEPRGRR